MVRTRRLWRLVAAGGGGALGALSLPPWGWWPLGIVGLALFCAAIDAQPWRDRALAGLVFGLGLFGVGLFWITEFHAVGFVLLILLETSFYVLGALAAPRPLMFPGAVVLAEVLRDAVPFGGLPLGGLALGQAGGPLVASARTGGALLVLGLTAALAAALVALVTDRRRTGAALAVGAVALAAIGWVAPGGRDDPARRPLRFALVQGGGIRGMRAVESDPSNVLNAHLRETRRVQPPVDVVLWPENAIDVIDIRYDEINQVMAGLARRDNSTLVAGVTQDAGDDNFVNVAVVWSPQGRIVDTYTKAHRVPFGEYVPLRGLISKLVDLTVLPRDAIAGKGPGLVRTPAGRFAVSISYEVFFSERARSGVRAGGGALLVPTNASSFTTSQVPTQEVAAAQLRAWETGRWVLQAAPTGYSAVVDADGRVHQRSVLGKPGLLRARVPVRTGRTIYVRLGDAPVIVIALTLVVAGAIARRRTVRTFEE